MMCKYCWAWRIPLNASRITRGKYDPVKEAEKYLRKKDRRVIVVSFSSDPYQQEEGKLQLTRRVLEVLSKAKQHRVLILTKNPKLALRDLDLMLEHGDMWLGTTITSLGITEWEPLAPPPIERLEALRKAHDAGVKTWVSIEPIIPEVTDPHLIIASTHGYVDWYVLGAFNYAGMLAPSMKHKLREWYLQHVPRALALLQDLSKPFFVKKELKRYLHNAV